MNDRLFEYIGKWSGLEPEMVESLEHAKSETTLDPSKQYFTYLLLDPLVSGLTDKRQLSDDVVNFWPQFLKSVFYIGKGKNSRPQDHLVDAVKLNKFPTSDKVWTMNRHNYRMYPSSIFLSYSKQGGSRPPPPPQWEG